MRDIKLLWKMIKFGRRWDNICDDCEEFEKPTDDSQFEYGYCNYFDADIECDCDFECVGECRGKKRWALLKSHATRCDDCKACDNSLWGKIKYVFNK